MALTQLQRRRERFIYALAMGGAGGMFGVVSFIVLVIACALAGAAWPSFVLPAIVCAIVGWYRSEVK